MAVVTTPGFALRCYFSASPSSSSSSSSSSSPACYHHHSMSSRCRVLEESVVVDANKKGWNVDEVLFFWKSGRRKQIKFVTKKTRTPTNALSSATHDEEGYYVASNAAAAAAGAARRRRRRKTTTNDDGNNANNNNQEKEQHQCHYCERTASSRWYKNKTQCNACYNRTRRIRIKNDLQTHSCEICQTSSSVEWYRNKFTGAKTGRLCHSCYCRERATALDVRCAECRSENTSGNWAIPKTKGKFKPGDRLCNVCYRRELVSLKAEAEEESTSEG